jgi:hypothetical protein
MSKAPRWGSSGVQAKIEIPGDDACSDQVNVLSGLLRPLNALRTRQQVFLKRGQFVFVYNHSKVVALQIVVRNMFHICLVADWSESSQENLLNLRQLALDSELLLFSLMVLSDRLNTADPIPSGNTPKWGGCRYCHGRCGWRYGASSRRAS